MKKNRIVMGGAVIVLILLFFWVGVKIVAVNTEYPSPSQEIYDIGEAYSDSTIALVCEQASIYTLESLNETYNCETPPSVLDSFSEKKLADMRVYCFTLTITNKADRPMELPAYTFNLESVDWANSISSAYFFLLNNTESFVLRIEPGQSETVTLPYFLPSEVFQETTDVLKERDFKLIYSVYPVKRGFSVSDS